MENPGMHAGCPLATTVFKAKKHSLINQEREYSLIGQERVSNDAVGDFLSPGAPPTNHIFLGSKSVTKHKVYRSTRSHVCLI